MSRIGNLPIIIPKGVDIQITPENTVTVKGPKGELNQQVDSGIKVTVADGAIQLKRTSETKDLRSKHGLYRSLINNMVVGVSEGHRIQLEVIGVGYRAQMQGSNLELSLGYSHHIVLQLPPEVKATAVQERGKNPIITLESNDKQLIGQVAAKIRSFRKPEPYKGKGILFVGEQIKRKAGKTAAATT